MKRQSRDNTVAVVRTECDVPHGGALMQGKASSRSAASRRSGCAEGGRRTNVKWTRSQGSDPVRIA
jgi:hypothetical protein